MRAPNVKAVRKRPVAVKAYRWEPGVGEDVREILPWERLPNDKAACRMCGYPHEVHGVMNTLEGRMVVCPGDWIITGVRGEKYPCKPDVFDATYEILGDG